MIELLFTACIGFAIGWMVLFVQYTIIKIKGPEYLFKCAACSNDLTVNQLIPRTLPFIKRKTCHRCKSYIMKDITLLPGLASLIIVVLCGQFNDLLLSSYMLLLLGHFYLVVYFDFKYTIIPNIVIVNMLVLISIHALFNFGQVSDLFYNHLIGVIISIVFVLLTMGVGKLVYKDIHVLGAGDVKLLIVLGWIFGLVGISIVINAALIIGSIYGIVQVKLHKNVEIPFGPFIVCGALLSLISGQVLI